MKRKSSRRETPASLRADKMRESEDAMNERARARKEAGRADAWDGSWLLGRIARRDHEALEELYRMWGDRIYSMALHWLNDEGAAREALQDCFLRVWKKAGHYEPDKGRAFTWCAMILRGICLDHLRKRRRRAAVWHDWESPGALEMTAAGSGVEDLFFRETVGRVRAALERLDREERESVRAALFDAGTLQDHAVRWGVPLGTAKTRVHRAMAKLRALLDMRKEAEDGDA